MLLLKEIYFTITVVGNNCSTEIIFLGLLIWRKLLSLACNPTYEHWSSINYTLFLLYIACSQRKTLADMPCNSIHFLFSFSLKRLRIFSRFITVIRYVRKNVVSLGWIQNNWKGMSLLCEVGGNPSRCLTLVSGPMYSWQNLIFFYCFVTATGRRHCYRASLPVS